MSTVNTAQATGAGVGAYTAHTDTFCRDNLPPSSQWPEFRFDLPELQYSARLNCASALLDGAIERHGRDRRALVTPDEEWSYGELSDRSNQIAHVLVDDLGVVPGNRVLLRGPNNPWLVASWLAVIKAGAVVVTTMPLLRTPELTKLVALCTPTVALCDHRFRDEIDPTDVRVVGFGSVDPDDLVTRAATKPTEFHAVDTAADDVVMLAPTSGTTGVPKATMHFHRDVLANADTFSRYVVKPNSSDLFAGTPPLAFTFGLGGLVVFPLAVGAASLLLERGGPEELAGAIEKHGVTVLFTAPTAYRAMMRGGHAGRLTSLRRCISAGEHLPASVWEQFHEQTGVRIINGIGGTEMLHIFISAADEDIRPGSTGRAVPGFRARIQNIDGVELPPGEPGLLAVQGPTGCRYLADERQLDYVHDGWNLTGDTYSRDAEGYFWYQARSDDMIVSSGYNIAAPEVESVIEQHPDVVESAVVGIPDDERGMIVHATVVLVSGAVGDAAMVSSIQNFVKKTAAPYKYPRAITFSDALPRTESGKLQRFRLRPGA